MSKFTAEFIKHYYVGELDSHERTTLEPFVVVVVVFRASEETAISSLFLMWKFNA